MRSIPSSIFTTMDSMAMIAPSTKSPREMMSAPSVIRSKTRSVIIMITNTAPKACGIAATTTIPTLNPRLSRLTSITTPIATAKFIDVGICPIEADKHLCAIRINRPHRSHRILSRESGKDVRWRDAQRRQPRIGKLDKYALLLLPYDIHLLDSRHVEKSLPEFFGDAG